MGEDIYQLRFLVINDCEDMWSQESQYCYYFLKWLYQEELEKISSNFMNPQTKGKLAEKNMPHNYLQVM